LCDNPDYCSGTGFCIANYEDQGTPCPDRRFCNGEEVCDDFGNCQDGEPPCPSEETCDELADECRQDQLLIRNYTPTAWQADEVEWIRDKAPFNKIDDLIDHSEEEGFDIVINFKHAVSDEDLGMLNDLGTSGLIQGRLKYLSSVMMGNLTKSEIELISGIEGVAFVEQQLGFSSTLADSVPQICVTPAAGGCAVTVPANIDGTGINIAIIDSGVDNTVHNGFTSGQYVGGYDAMTKKFIDPDDEMGHGTHVASIALGNGSASTSRGVAPGAGLIDIRVFGANAKCNTPGMWAKVTDGLETLYDKRNTWGVDVVNMSFGSCNASGPVLSDGIDAFSQLVDLAESMGIVVVAAAGNNGPSNTGLTSPAAATRAITVAASETANTPTRADTAMAGFSSRGPRGSDGDSDTIDELKPEVTAPGAALTDDAVFDNDAADADAITRTRTTLPVNPGTNVTINVVSSADIAPGETMFLYNIATHTTTEAVTVTTSVGAGGTSFTATTTIYHPINTGVWENGNGITAAEHDTADGAVEMSGTSMAAPHVAGLAALIMQDRPGINAASIKDLIIRTAQRPPGTPASLPGSDPDWNNRWGWGEVNASAAINLSQDTDLTFPSHPASPHWLSPDIKTTLLRKNLPATVTARIRNQGPAAAQDVQVHFGVHVYSASTPTFYDLGTQIVDIPVNLTGYTEVPIPWTPKDLGHQCFKVEIGYGADTDYSNNTAQRNLQITNDPVTFKLKNTLTDHLSLINLVPFLDDPDSGWEIELSPTEAMLGPDDPPAEITARLIPPDYALPGSAQTLHIEAVIDTVQGQMSLGGVSLKSVVSCEFDADLDGDVDGRDLQAMASGMPIEDLSAFALNFGSTGCTDDIAEQAFCLPQGVCTYELPHICAEQLGGTPLGEGVDCYEAPCQGSCQKLLLL